MNEEKEMETTQEEAHWITRDGFEETPKSKDSQPETSDIRVTSLSDWLPQNVGHFEHLNIIKMKVKGVDPSKTIILARPDRRGGYDHEGYDKRELFLFKDAASIPVLDLSAQFMDVFKRGFIIINQYDKNTYLRCYGARGRLSVFFCLQVDDYLIPYGKNRVTKKDQGVSLVKDSRSKMLEKLNSPVDMEALRLLYKQVEEVRDGLKTTREAVVWLLGRQRNFNDVVHLIQIDDVIRTLVS